MTLSEILSGVTVIKLFHMMFGRMVVTHDLEITGIRYDSRTVTQNNLFVAIRGTAVNGHAYIEEAIHRGAKAVIVEDDAAMPDSFFMHAGVAKIVVEDSRKTLADVSANFYRHPAGSMKVIGVTGTNGKTTTTCLIKSILQAAGENVGLLGTIGYSVGDTILPATHTTPESLELQQVLREMADRGCTTVVMEVSSHSLVMSRVRGLNFAVGVFTNLTQDHLDFHGTMEEYFLAKQMLFKSLSPAAHAVVNNDDAYGKRILASVQGKKVTFGLSPEADVSASGLEMRFDETNFTVSHRGQTSRVHSSLIGSFNVQNILASYAAGVALGVSEETIRAGIGALHPVRGRFEQVASPRGWTAVIDYAHTPDALENCLRTIGLMMPQPRRERIITLFGCGGNRDRGKRPLMGRIASSLSDKTIISSDNPRNEDPLAIMNDIAGGIIPGADVEMEPDRKKAIRLALGIARSGDVVLIAGKGHEDYKIIGERKIHLDDREEVKAFIRGEA